MIRCCIFDLDGTLINTVDALKKTTNLVLDQLGCSHVEDADIKRIVGDGFRNQLKRALAITGDPELEHYEEAEALYPAVFAENCLYHIRAYDGICELLEELKARRVKVAVLTNKPHERAIENLDLVFGENYFDYVLGEQPGLPKKPDPEGVHRIMNALDVEAEECLYFGDTNTDMRTGLGAGLTTVGVTWGFRGREELEEFHPQYIIDHPMQVFELIFNIYAK
ncbi:MAG: HAD family hydrolase [Brotaphodocola sp.]